MTKLNEIELGQLCQSTIESLYEATGGMKQFPGLLKKIIETKAWLRRISSGKVVELTSLRELITAKPVRGWGEDIKTVEAVIRNDPKCLLMFREAMKHQGKAEDFHNNVMEVKQGNSRAYSIARVQSQCDANSEAQLWLRSELAGTQAVTVKQGGDRRSVNIKVDNINIDRGGTGAPYLLRRLAKTEPAIVKRYQAGEFASVRAAALVRRIQ